jgi:Ca2+-binding EF-hand superfamily protein
MKCFNNDDLDLIRNNIIHYCNEFDNMNSEGNKDWIDNIMNKIGMYINEEYGNDIKSFYDDYNVTDFRNKGQGLSFDNFEKFIQRNYLLFEPYHINKNINQQKALFNYISNNKKYITIDDLEYFFGIENNNKNDNYDYDFYEKMHNDIITFLYDNFENGEDGFKYFHNGINDNTYNIDNAYITKKEFFNGISNMFPKRYQTNTIQNYYNKYFDNKDKISYSDFKYIYYNTYNYNEKYTQSLKNPSKVKTTRPDVSAIPFMTEKSPFPTEKNPKLKTAFDLDPLEKMKRLILSSKIDFKKECEYYLELGRTNYGLINQFEFRNLIKKLNLGLSCIEIEDIINKNKMTYNGLINIYDFYEYITNTELNLYISEKNIIEVLKQLKQYIYKYYNSPRFAFEINDRNKKGFIDFEQFKKLIYELFYKEKKPVPNYPVMKYVYDYIDVRKDGVIDLNEWSKVFAITESNLDVIKGPGSQYIRDWEGSEEITEIYKLISKNKKAIKDKVKLYTIRTSDNLLIQEKYLIDILINILGKKRMSYPQWKMIVALGDKERNGVIDFNEFIRAIESYANIQNSHPKYMIKNK